MEQMFVALLHQRVVMDGLRKSLKEIVGVVAVEERAKVRLDCDDLVSRENIANLALMQNECLKNVGQQDQTVRSLGNYRGVDMQWDTVGTFNCICMSGLFWALSTYFFWLNSRNVNPSFHEVMS